MKKFDALEDVEIFSIMPGALVYRNVSSKINEILSFFKEAEDYSEDRYSMKKLSFWGDHGIMSEMDSAAFHFDLNNDEQKKQKDIFTEILRSYNLVKDDYLSRYNNTDIWPSSYKKVNLLNEFHNTKIAFMKYHAEYQNKTSNPTAFPFHSDIFSQNMDSDSPKLIFTVMIYLNDDYEGGELCFLNKEKNKVIGYKPKAGDMLAFPSCEPFYHAIFNVFKNDRYAIRVNYVIGNDGSEEWKMGNIQYNEEKHNHQITVSWKENNLIKTADSNNDFGKDIEIKYPPVILNTKDMERIK